MLAKLRTEECKFLECKQVVYGYALKAEVESLGCYEIISHVRLCHASLLLMMPEAEG